MRHLWLGSILLSTALSSAAVTLGPHSGGAVLGRPLDIQIQTFLAPGEVNEPLCVRPEVFFGETPVSPVSAEIHRRVPGAEPLLRVQTSQAINEPFVTVVVSIGCGAPFSRRYVLLADPVSNAQTIPVISARSEVLVRQSNSSASTTVTPASPTRGGKTEKPKVRNSRSAPAKAVPANSARKPAPPKPTGSRLELDPLDIALGTDRDPVLRLSPTLLNEPTLDESARQTAIAAWKSINASPESFLNDAKRLALLEAEVNGLREREDLRQAELARLQAELETSKQYRRIAYTLAGLLGLFLVSSVWFWRRRAAMPRPSWWNDDAPSHVDASTSPHGKKKAAPVAAAVTARKDRPVASLDLDLTLDVDSSFDLITGQDSLPAVVKPRSVRDSEIRREFASSSLPPTRSVATEELFDVQQQADFFVSLGQHEQAIQILRDHLEESHEPSPLAYLDLLKIYHDLGRVQDYEALRADFNMVFNAGAPPFGEFAHGSNGLESYETAFSRIQALWPQPKVLDVIERSIFRDSQTTDGEVFDLEAYRELLFLHAVAKEMIQREAIEDGLEQDFQHTALKPLKAVTRPAPLETMPSQLNPQTTGNQVTEPMPSRMDDMLSNIGLDVDLDELVDISAFEASLPEVKEEIESTAQVSQQNTNERSVNGDLIDFDFLDPESKKN